MTEVIRVRGLTFLYPKSPEPAVRGMDFTVGRGEIFGFLGPSGAGKSTTQKLLIGLLRGHGGAAAVWGKDPLAWGPDYYQRIGVSFELPNHYQKLTGLENLRFFASLYEGETLDPMELLDAVGLAEDAGTRVGKYSKGMQMRLTFARSLINNPELLFLDEPTSGMDPVNARKVKNIVLDLKARGRRCSSPPTTCRPPTSCATGWRSSSTARSLSVETIHSKEGNLEDVFVEVTGRRLS
jgi:fluoroquinolone transport system ATP-binding protein